MMAGMIGINPLPLTLRELVDMYDGSSEQRWAETSRVEAIVYNMNRGVDSPEMLARQFNPLYQHVESEQDADSFWDSLERA